jgi:hypothetical protein
MLRFITLLSMSLMLAGGAAWADPPAHAQGKGKGGKKSERATEGAISAKDRDQVRDFYGNEFKSGKCPPGLAKKNNGCMPPGQAKKWARGKPLPKDVTYYPLPPDLLGRLVAPAGTQYVRVAADILLIAAGTGMVLDAIEDLSRL